MLACLFACMAVCTHTDAVGFCSIFRKMTYCDERAVKAAITKCDLETVLCTLKLMASIKDKLLFHHYDVFGFVIASLRLKGFICFIVSLSSERIQIVLESLWIKELYIQKSACSAVVLEIWQYHDLADDMICLCQCCANLFVCAMNIIIIWLI